MRAISAEPCLKGAPQAECYLSPCKLLRVFHGNLAGSLTHGNGAIPLGLIARKTDLID